MAEDALRDGVMDMLIKDKKLPSSESKKEKIIASVKEKMPVSPMVVVQEQVEVPEKKTDDMVERLADYAHTAWSGWMEYLFENSSMNKDGSVVIPADLINRWQLQMGTDYGELSETMKESDRKEARKMLEITGKKVVQESKKSKPRKDMSDALNKVVENQSKVEIEHLSTDAIEDNIKSELGKKQRKEIYEAMFRKERKRKWEEEKMTQTKTK